MDDSTDFLGMEREFQMKPQLIRLTEFREQEMRCIGGDGQATAYQITTAAGRELGTISQILPPPEIKSANRDCDQIRPSLLRRLANILA